MKTVKYKRPQREVQCSNLNCARLFFKDVSEIRRNLKLSRPNYCSLTCTSKTNDNLEGNRSTKHLKDVIRRDEFTGFREHLRRVKNRSSKKGHIVSITLQDLLDVWELQKGICPYTGVKLLYPNLVKNDLLNVASLDRIDSTKGYEVNNLQFVSAAANLAKNRMSHNDMIRFCKLIASHWINTEAV